MLPRQWKNRVRPFVPPPILELRRAWRDLPLARLRYAAVPGTTFEDRANLVRRIRAADAGIRCAHTSTEIREIVTAILSLPREVAGCVVEAGCFKGGSTAKLSLAASLVNRKLVVFDSFQGLPQHNEPHERTIFGHPTSFTAGKYSGRLDDVRRNVEQFGAPDVCTFVPGWFDDTMPSFNEPVAVAFVDVDLASSTRTCLRYLYPLLVPGGSIFSHDGHLPLCLEVIRDDAFWADDIGAPRPPIAGLGRRKLLQITKPRQA
jgi:O-methyltransferase